MDTQRFARLLLEQPELIIETVREWVLQKAEEVRASHLDEPSARMAAELIADCPDGNPGMLITRPMLPAAINMTVDPGTSHAAFIETRVLPFLAAERRLRDYQATACQMMMADCSQFLDLADMLTILLTDAPVTDPVNRRCLQYVIFHFVLCDLLPTSVFAAELVPFLSLYTRLASEDAHSPVAVTSALIAVIEAWLVSLQAPDGPAP